MRQDSSKNSSDLPDILFMLSAFFPAIQVKTILAISYPSRLNKKGRSYEVMIYKICTLRNCICKNAKTKESFGKYLRNGNNNKEEDWRFR